MIERLARGPATVSELAALLPMSLPSAVQQLGVLEASGLARSEKVGRVRTCQLVPGALRSAEDWIAGCRTQWEQRFDRLGDYMAAHPESPKPHTGDDLSATTEETP
jgi:DNA-binding transcriptional ArsR family regulator